MIRIAITGPECTGKTLLMNWLSAKIFDVRVFPEYSRQYLENKKGGPSYGRDDLVTIGREMAARMVKAFRSDNDVLICDTDFYVLEIWWK